MKVKILNKQLCHCILLFALRVTYNCPVNHMFFALGGRGGGGGADSENQEISLEMEALKRCKYHSIDGDQR